MSSVNLRVHTCIAQRHFVELPHVSVSLFFQDIKFTWNEFFFSLLVLFLMSRLFITLSTSQLMKVLTLNQKRKKEKNKLGREERHVHLRACWPPRVLLIAASMCNLLDTQKFGHFGSYINFSPVTPASTHLHTLTFRPLMSSIVDVPHR